MRSFTLEAIRILSLWSECIFGNKTKPTDSTTHTNARCQRKASRLIRLPGYKDDADEQYKFGKLCSSTQNYHIGFQWFRLAAKQDHGEAQFVLGLIYEKGSTVERDYAEAVRWFKRSAEQGFALGQHNYARMLALGLGIEKKRKEVIKWYKLAAEQGIPEAQYLLGVAYSDRRFSDYAKQNFQEAIKWLRLSADQDNPDAQFHLGLIHHKGGILERGQQNEFDWRKISDKDRISEKQLDLWLGCDTKDEVAQDFEEAIKWYQLAADQDNPDAQFNLGLMYLKGQGVPEDHETGIDLIERASEQDHLGALYHLGLAYDLGDGVEPDDDYSNLNYEVAAEYGHSGARFGMTGDGSQNYRGN
ncbi:MAG: sel1 repeat family protein [Nitrospina sp.]|jgi:uncharacterized protein|nr:sel1 repeat family protein [Nitrospina sp.]